MKTSINILLCLLFININTPCLASEKVNVEQSESDCDPKQEQNGNISMTKRKDFLEKRTVEISVIDNSEQTQKALGTILAKGERSNSYLIVSASFTLGEKSRIKIKTFDDEEHSGRQIQQIGKRLSILRFESNKEYCGFLSDSILTGDANKDMEVGTGTYQKKPGDIRRKYYYEEKTIKKIISPPVESVYKIGHSIFCDNSSRKGKTDTDEKSLVGAPIIYTSSPDLNLIGITGISCYPIIPEYKDRQDIQELKQLNLAIPIRELLEEISPEIQQKFSLPFAENNPGKYIKGLIDNLRDDEEVKKLQDKVKGFTVKVNEGSGVVIGKRKKRNLYEYKVLTAKHNLDARRNSVYIGREKIEKYEIDVIDVQEIGRVDLALITFQSHENKIAEDIAKISNKREDDKYVFTGGYSKSLGWFFSPGQINENQIVIQPENSRRPGSLKNTTFNILSAVGTGYKLVYSNITFGGMSGGPVVNLRGEVIGIHGTLDTSKDIESYLPVGYGNSLGIDNICNYINNYIRCNQMADEGFKPQNSLSQNTEELIEKIKNVELPRNISVEDLINQAFTKWRYRNYDGSSSYFKQAIERYNKNKGSTNELDDKNIYLAHYGLGISLYNQKMFQESIESFENSIRIFKKVNEKDEQSGEFIPALYYKSQANRNLKRIDEALENIDIAINSLKRQNNRTYQSGNSDQGLDSLYSLENLLIQKSELLLEEVSISSNQKKLIEAKESIELAIAKIGEEKKANRPSFHNFLGVVLMKLGKVEDAKNEFEKAIELNLGDKSVKEDIEEAYMNAADAYYQLALLQREGIQKEYLLKYSSKSLESVAKTIGISQTLLPFAKNIRGLIAIEEDNLSQAEREIKDAVQILKNIEEETNSPDKNLSLFYRNLGNIYVLRGKWNEAIENYEESIKIDRNNAESYFNLGFVYSQQGNRKKSRENYNQAVKINPDLKKVFQEDSGWKFDVALPYIYPEGIVRRQEQSNRSKDFSITPKSTLSRIHDIPFFGSGQGDTSLGVNVKPKLETWIGKDKYTSLEINGLINFQRQRIYFEEQERLQEVSPEWRYGIGSKVSTLIFPDDYRRSSWIGTGEVEYQRISTDSRYSVSGSGFDDLLKVGVGVQRDKRNDFFNPNEGSFLKVSLQQYIPINNSAVSISKLEGKFSWYIPVESQNVVFNIEGGTIFTPPPIYEMFRSLSINSNYGLRGQNYVRLNADYRTSPFKVFFINLYSGGFFDYSSIWGNVDERSGVTTAKNYYDGYGYGPFINFLITRGVNARVSYDVGSKGIIFNIGAGF